MKEFTLFKRKIMICLAEVRIDLVCSVSSVTQEDFTDETHLQRTIQGQ